MCWRFVSMVVLASGVNPMMNRVPPQRLLTFDAVKNQCCWPVLWREKVTAKLGMLSLLWFVSSSVQSEPCLWISSLLYKHANTANRISPPAQRSHNLCSEIVLVTLFPPYNRTTSYRGNWAKEVIWEILLLVREGSFRYSVFRIYCF